MSNNSNFFVLYRKQAKQREKMPMMCLSFWFFPLCKSDNPQFFSDFQLDNEGKILSIFWSHASQQGEYDDFGDAVTFDTTHKTNLYGKPLGMFVGSNHHLQCTMFGFSLLGDETVKTFKWVFNAFKTCMGTEGPRVMFTGMIYVYIINMNSKYMEYIFNNLCIFTMHVSHVLVCTIHCLQK
jgi:hypothetical protein